MELDELRGTWAENDRRLETSLRLNRHLLSTIYLDRARTRLSWVAAYAIAEVGVTLALIGVLGGYIYEHLALPQFAVPAAALDLFAIAVVIARTRQMAAALRVDYGQPIAAIQHQIESLNIQRIRYTQRVLVIAPLLWTPLLIVALQALFGLDAYRVPGAGWLAANLAVGLAIIPLAIWLSRRFGDRMGAHPVVQRLMRDLAGHNLKAAARFLATLSQFEAA